MRAGWRRLVRLAEPVAGARQGRARAAGIETGLAMKTLLQGFLAGLWAPMCGLTHSGPTMRPCGRTSRCRHRCRARSRRRPFRRASCSQARGAPLHRTRARAYPISLACFWPKVASRKSLHKAATAGACVLVRTSKCWCNGSHAQALQLRLDSECAWCSYLHVLIA